MEIVELKAAFRAGTPVIYEGITYSCISALIYRRGKGQAFIQAELADRQTNSVTIARPDWIKKAENVH